MTDIQSALDRTKGNVSAAAKLLGIPRTTLRCKIGMNEPEKLPARHLVIPDTQVKAGVPLEHLTWAGKYAAEKQPPVIVFLGDHADMPSLSTYDKGKKSFEGRRYKSDIAAANKGMDLFMAEVRKDPTYTPRIVLLLGNHENRINRAVECQPELEGLLSTDDLNYADHGIEIIPFLDVIKIDGIAYSHYFYNPNSGKPFGGTCHVKLKNVGMSFIMGHQQGLDMAMRELPDGSIQMGMVAGSFYQHQEDYKGPQGNGHWQGIVMLNEVRNGRYDPMPLSMDYLRRRYATTD